mmetsp:Transcript_14705/g.44107  ORF Transcript_14705/g.44107 Transcript_14705/m.44107 type:complete len:233 (+) Transcript_14705:1629-2327(+)
MLTSAPMYSMFRRIMTEAAILNGVLTAIRLKMSSEMSVSSFFVVERRSTFLGLSIWLDDSCLGTGSDSSGGSSSSSGASCADSSAGAACTASGFPASGWSSEREGSGGTTGRPLAFSGSLLGSAGFTWAWTWAAPRAESRSAWLPRADSCLAESSACPLELTSSGGMLAMNLAAATSAAASSIFRSSSVIVWVLMVIEVFCVKTLCSTPPICWPIRATSFRMEFMPSSISLK